MEEDKSSPSNNGPTPPSASEQELQPFSCILCKQRKIKCDKHYPCQNCTKAKSQCIFRAPAPPRRGKRKPAEVNLLARLKRYEDMLQGLGVSIEKLKIEDEDKHSKDEKTSKPEMFYDQAEKEDEDKLRKLHPGKLIADEGKSIYVEDNLWTSLSEELKVFHEVLQSDEEDEALDQSVRLVDRNAYELNSAANQLVFNLGTHSPSLRIPHPPIEHVQRLWEVYKTNFHPITMILHTQTAQEAIFRALQNPDKIPKNLEALIFAVYCGAIGSLETSDTLAWFGEEQPTMMVRYTLAAQQAFVKVGLLKSTDLMVVQAYTIYLLANRFSLDPRSIWMLTGINLRLAQRIGLHRDGLHLNLTPFETEMRRRLWWQVLVLDVHAAVLTGSGQSSFNQAWDTHPPLNVNDSDLSPSMPAPPLEREGPTDMFFCLLRHEFGKFFRQSKTMFHDKRMLGLTQEQKNEQIDAVERNIEQKFLRYCDPLNQLHALAQAAGRGAVASMRLMANHPRHTMDNGASLTPENRTKLFQSALKIVEYDSASYSDPRLRGYRWHVRAYFQYNAFVFLLSELCKRGLGEDVDRAWLQISNVFRNHPEMRSHRMLQVSVVRLVCKAWANRAAALIQAGEQPSPPPGVADVLAQRAYAERRADSGSGPSGGGAGGGSTSGGGTGSSNFYWGSNSNNLSRTNTTTTPTSTGASSLSPTSERDRMQSFDANSSSRFPRNQSPELGRLAPGIDLGELLNMDVNSRGTYFPTSLNSWGGTSGPMGQTTPGGTTTEDLLGGGGSSSGAGAGAGGMSGLGGAASNNGGGSTGSGDPDLDFDFNALQHDPTPMDWAAWDEILQASEKNGMDSSAPGGAFEGGAGAGMGMIGGTPMGGMAAGMDGMGGGVGAVSGMNFGGTGGNNNSGGGVQGSGFGGNENYGMAGWNRLMSQQQQQQQQQQPQSQPLSEGDALREKQAREREPWDGDVR